MGPAHQVHAPTVVLLQEPAAPQEREKKCHERIAFKVMAIAIAIVIGMGCLFLLPMGIGLLASVAVVTVGVFAAFWKTCTSGCKGTSSEYPRPLRPVNAWHQVHPTAGSSGLSAAPIGQSRGNPPPPPAGACPPAPNGLSAGSSNSHLRGGAPPPPPAAGVAHPGTGLTASQP